jgi:hypothetical protein
MNLMHIEYPKTFLMEYNEFEKITLCTYYETHEIKNHYKKIMSVVICLSSCNLVLSDTF